MGEYVLDRFDGQKWTTMMASAEPVNPQMFSIHPLGPYEIETPAFAGLPGYKIRHRYIDETTDMELEVYEWNKIPSNPYDEYSHKVWGWECVKRAKYPSVSRSPEFMRVGVSW